MWCCSDSKSDWCNYGTQNQRHFWDRARQKRVAYLFCIFNNCKDLNMKMCYMTPDISLKETFSGFRYPLYCLHRDKIQDYEPGSYERVPHTWWHTWFQSNWTELLALLQSPFLKRWVIVADIHSSGASNDFRKILEKRVARKWWVVGRFFNMR